MAERERELRHAVRIATRADEAACVGALVGRIPLDDGDRAAVDARARALVEGMRANRRRFGGLDDFLQEYVLQIGRAHVCTPVTNANLVFRLLLEQKKKKNKLQHNR